VCDELVLIDAGRLVHQGPVAGFTAATPTLDVEVDGGAERLAARLSAQGLAATVDRDHVLIASDGTPPYDAVRDAVVELGIGLVRMQHRRRTLDELFTVAQPAGAGGARD
jgi:ABC-2 type transport system ATP-binding protein